MTKDEALKSLWNIVESALKVLKANPSCVITKMTHVLWAVVEAAQQDIHSLNTNNPNLQPGKFYRLQGKEHDKFLVFRMEGYTQNENSLGVDMRVLACNPDDMVNNRPRLNWYDVKDHMVMPLSQLICAEEEDIPDSKLPTYQGLPFTGTLLLELMKGSNNT